MPKFFSNPSIILDVDLLDDAQRQKLEDLGYSKSVNFYGCQYNAFPVYCWIREIDEDIEIADWEEENLPFEFEVQQL